MSKKAPAPTPPTVHTLTSLKKALGDATLEEAEALLDGHDKTSLVEEGSTVVTTRISTDTARNYGIAFDFLKVATTAQLDHVPTLTTDWLRVAVWLAAEGQSLYGLLTAQKTGSAGLQEEAIELASKLRPQADTKRDQLRAAIKSFAGGDKVLLTAAATAYGKASDIAGAIQAQTALVRSWWSGGSAGVKKRIGASRLNDAWLGAADTLASDYAAAEEAAGATRTRPATVTQADVDYADGMNLELHDALVAQFDAGHAADPAIPRLQYNSLLSHARRGRVTTGGSSPTAPTQPLQTTDAKAKS